MTRPRTLSAPERLYLLRRAERSSPPPESPPKPQPVPQPPLRLTREDVDAIIANRRSATVEEVEWVLSHGNDARIGLTTVDEFHLRTIAARALADRHVAHIRRATDPSEEFEVRVLKLYPTEYGSLTAEEVERLESIRLKATAAIQNCSEHKRERCRCWSEAREQLYTIRCDCGEKSAMGMAALGVWNSVERVGRDRSDPPQPPLILNISPQAASDILGRPAPNPYRWQGYKSTYPGCKS